MSSDIYCSGLSSPLLPDGYGSFHWRGMALHCNPGLVLHSQRCLFLQHVKQSSLCGQVFCLAPVWGQNNFFFHWGNYSPPESLFLKRCFLHLLVKLRVEVTFSLLFFWSEKPSSIIVQLEVHWPTSQSAVLSYTTFTLVSTVLAFPLSELPYVHVSLSIFSTFHNIYLFDFPLS